MELEWGLFAITVLLVGLIQRARWEDGELPRRPTLRELRYFLTCAVLTSLASIMFQTCSNLEALAVLISKVNGKLHVPYCK